MNTAGVNIRDAKIDDVNELVDVHVKSWQSAYRGLIPDDILDNISREDRAEMWSGTIRDKPSETIVFLGSGKIIGFANFGESQDNNDAPPNGQIRAIYILKDYWRIGSELLKYAEESLKLKYHCVVLWVLGSNDRAIEFYEKQRYVKDGAEKTETIFESTLSEIRMVKNINS